MMIDNLVKITCGAKNCGNQFLVSHEVIRHEKKITCYCGWEGENPYFKGGLDDSFIKQEKKAGSGVRESNNPIAKKLREVVFGLKIKNKGWNLKDVADAMGFDGNEERPQSYLSLLLSDFDKWFPKTKEAQDRILEKIERGVVRLNENPKQILGQEMGVENEK